MKQIYFVIVFLVKFYSLNAQQVKPDSMSKTVNINEVVISANKVEEVRANVAQQVQVIDKSQIDKLNAQTTAELISNTGSVGVQKSQQGGGSPIIRGFEASRVLLMVDGVRMNNLIYRSGHLQNIITIDQSMLRKVEIVFGPSSTIYGSDALGGTLYFYTINPLFAKPNQSMNFHINAFTRYSSVNNEQTGHIDVNLGLRKFASLTAISYSKFGDLQMGKTKNPYYDEFGQRINYAGRINGKDSTLINSNSYLQRTSGYSQYDILQKFVFNPNERSHHLMNIQLSNSSNIPRYDRLTEYIGENMNFAEWYYGPQKRLMAAYSFDKYGFMGFTNVHFGANYQKVNESRHQRKFNSNFLQSTIEDVDVVGYNLAFRKTMNKNDVRFGIDGQLNWLSSTARKTDITNNQISTLNTRYPDGSNTMRNVATYIRHTLEIGENLVLNDGLRIGLSTLKSTFIDTTFFLFPFKEVLQNNTYASGNVSIIFRPTGKWKISLSTSTGFRVPNVDDLSKIFESTKGTLIVPNPYIKPEKTINVELGITKYFDDNVRWENTVFYTFFNDLIITDNFTFNGNDSILYSGSMSKVLAKQNKGKAYLTGFNSNVLIDFSGLFSASAFISYTYGRIKTDSTDAPLDHISPLTGRISFEFHQKKTNAEFFVNFNGWKKLKNYYLNGEDNEQYATPEGMPAWYILNLRLSYKVHKTITLQLGIDNILDTQYRVFASGINAPGRNVFGVVRFNY